MSAPSFSSRRNPRATPFPRHVLGPLALSLLVVTLAGCGHKSALSPDVASATFGKSPVAVATSAEAAVAGIRLDAPVHLEGESGPGARWEIDVPQEWNGDLVVYLHGYSSPNAEVALPQDGGVIAALVAKGYAVAASSFSENGYAVKEGVQQSHQLSGLFASRVALPRRTFLLGKSMGGLIGLLLSEKYPGEYAGSLLVSGVVGGSDDEVEYLGDIRVLFDAAYPGVLPGDLEHPGVVTNELQQVVGPVVAAVQANPQGLGIIQLLARHPLPGNTSQEIVTSLATVLVFAMQGGGDFLDRTHGHSYFDNQDYRYTSPALPTGLVDDINARLARYSRGPDAVAYLAHYGEPSGDLRIPLLTLHNSRDPVVPAWHEGLLGQSDSGPWLLQRQVSSFGHVNFTVAQLMTGFDDLVTWADTGQKPAL